VVLGDAQIETITVDSNVISSAATDGDILLTPHGTGKLVLSAALSSQTGEDLILIAATGQAVKVDGSSVTVDNLKISNNVIEATDTDGAITLSGTGSGRTILTGVTEIDNLQISGNTMTSTDTDGKLNMVPYASRKLVFGLDAADSLTSANAATIVGSLAIGTNALSFDGSTITAASGNINLMPNGNGKVITNSIMSATGEDLMINTGDDLVTISGTAKIGSLELSGTTISAVGDNDDVLLTSNGVGSVVLGSVAVVDNLKLDGNTISTTDTDGDLHLAPAGSGQVSIDSHTVKVGNLNVVGSTISTESGNVMSFDRNGEDAACAFGHAGLMRITSVACGFSQIVISQIAAL
jgi:hypothetical protein